MAGTFVAASLGFSVRDIGTAVEGYDMNYTSSRSHMKSPSLSGACLWTGTLGTPRLLNMCGVVRETVENELSSRKKDDNDSG